jgi:MFS family permease
VSQGGGSRAGLLMDPARHAERVSGAATVRAPALVAVGSLITVAFMGSVIVTPLYALYQREFGFSVITLTLIYAVYVVGNVMALLVFGQISDQIGRKRVALPALALAAASAALFLFADSIVWLFIGRLLIGLAVGVASGTGTAWLGDLHGEHGRSRATLAAATANLAGIAIGPPIAGVLAQYAPAPLRLPFVAYIVAVTVVAVAVARAPEPHRERAVTLRSVRVHARIGVPRERLGSFTAPAVTGFVIFALGGLYFALIPSIVIDELHQHNVAVGALLVFELATFAAAVTLLGRRLPPASAMDGGLLILLPAIVLIVCAQAAGSMPLLISATALAGVAMGFGYRGSLEVVNEIAPQQRRAEVVSTYFIACFVGNSLPVIGLGVLTTLTTPLPASIAFAATIAVLSATALAWHRRARTA